MSSLSQFEDLLKAVDLAAYRKKYQPIKLVEMDLPKDIQALDLLYEVYWVNKWFVGYDEFYEIYAERYKEPIEAFRQKITMCQECFYRGLPARIYRTWASIITQIHAGYVAESVFGAGTVSMSAQLDHSGADFQVNYKAHVINYQVKKKSFSREVRASKQVGKMIDGEFVDIKYDVPSGEYFTNPYRRDGEYRLPYLRFISNPELTRYPNGFVVFTPHVFEAKKAELDRIS